MSKQSARYRHLAKLLAFVIGISLALPITGCNTPEERPANPDRLIRIGTMATEDMLPYWLAEQDKMFTAYELKAEVITFQSAQELSTAFAAGEIDMAMTDAMVAVSLVAGGTPLQILWVALGMSADEGRFGILANPNRGIDSLEDLAGVPVAIGSNTIAEYTFDRLMLAAGVPAEDIAYEEVMKVPVRYEMLVNNQVAAAALPASLLYLGEQNGMVLVADDLKGENISQTIMVARSDFLESVSDTDAIYRLQQVWNDATFLINDNPRRYQTLLAEKAQLPAEIADSYPMQVYPPATRPPAWMIDDVINWMDQKGYLTAPVSYDQVSGDLTRITE